MKKFLICGLGSIGQRHVRLLRKQFGNEVDLHAFRVRGLNQVVHDNMQAEDDVCPVEFYGLTAHANLEAALALRPEAVWVTNPISLHLEVAQHAAEAGCHLFIEKPVAHSLEGIATLEATLQAQSKLACVGYQLRFHPALIQIRQWLADRAIGQLIRADVHFGEWLPGMHPYEDYRISHAARKDQGGGAIFCLSHEIDYACWLFGRPRCVTALGGTFGGLEMDVENTADLFLECEDQGNRFPVTVHVDFLQRPPQRYCTIVGDQGRIEWNNVENTLHLHQPEQHSPEVIRFDSLERNDLFIAQQKNFLNSITGKTTLVSPLSDSTHTLRVCLAARESIAARQPVTLEP